jgi:flagellar hook-length control protein FliK
MVGRYFPGYDPGSIVPAAGKTLLAGNGFNLGADSNEAESGSAPRLQFPTLAGEVSFASTVRDLESDASATSIQSQTISQILAQAETLTGRQTRSLRLRLRPEELGEIDIQLSRDAAGRISAHISAERESARVALSRSLDQLRDTLSRAGLTVDKLQINAEPGLFAGNRENNDAGSNTRQSSSGIANLLTENETEASGQPRADDEKLLSLHA